MKTSVAAALAASLALCGAAHAQGKGNSGSQDSGAQAAPEGTLSSDVNGSTTMPAEIVPGSVGASGTRVPAARPAGAAPSSRTGARRSAPRPSEAGSAAGPAVAAEPHS